jgi:hypothetical protein
MTESEPRSITKTDWLLIGALVLLVLPLRLWLLYNTEVTARDSIGYIRYALQFERISWPTVLKDNHQHPGYPALVWLMSVPVRALDGETTPENMELSAQVVNLFAALLLIVPMYLLGRQFFDRPVSFWGTLLYQYLPISAQHLSDGISEPMYLVLLVSGLLQAVHAVRERQIGRCALCGVFAGLAYLTRPEGAVILPAFACVLIGMQFRPEWRCSWPRFLACGGTALLTAMLIGSIYIGATGRITNKLSAIEIINNLREIVGGLFLSRESQGAANGSMYLFGVSFPVTANRGIRLLRSAWALIAEVTQGFHYIAGISAVLGFCGSFGTLRRQPTFWVLMVFSLLHSLLLIALAMSVSYVSDRHVMILVLGGCFFVIVGLRELPRRVLVWLKIDENVGANMGVGKTWYRTSVVWFGVLLAALFVICLPKSMQRLHGNRVSNHAAGLWLAENLKEGDLIIDDHSWSHFFAGAVFREGTEPALSRDQRPNCYVVITRSRDPQIDEKRQAGVLEKDAEIVWPGPTERENARVVVRLQRRDFEKNPWRKLPE